MKHVYLREINPTANDSLSKLVGLISPEQKVLDVGTGSGALGQYLKRRQCLVDGLTYSSEEADLARSFYSRLEIINLEQVLPSSVFNKYEYNIIVCADILEHLRNPSEILSDLQDLLAPGGKLLISIPNATYMGVIFGLMGSRFVRTQEGLLDKTHVQFFDRAGLEKLVSESGLMVTASHDVRKGLAQSEFAALDTLALPAALRSYVGSLPDADVYQFVWELAPSYSQTLITPPPVLPEITIPPKFCAQLFGDFGKGFEESSSRYAWGNLEETPQTLAFDELALLDAKALRLDFSDRPGLFEFFGLRLFNAQNEKIWQWNGDWSASFMLNQCEILPSIGLYGGRLIRATGNDPWVGIPADTTWADAVCAEIELTAPQPYLDAAFAWSSIYYQRSIARNEEALLSLEKQLHDATYRNISLQANVDDLIAERNLLTTERNKLISENGIHYNRIESLQSTLGEVYNSTSWRITAGLRAIMRTLRKH